VLRDAVSAAAAAESLAAAGRLDQAGRIARDTLAKPVPPLAEARLRCALSSVLCCSGRTRDAAAEAGLVLAQPQLPADVRDAALIAQLTALAGLRGEDATSVTAPVLADPHRFDNRAVVAALVVWESLTETERAVSELVAQGLSNREAAARMYVSVHTVAFYLRQIFRKLEIGSRVELARIVVKRATPGAGTEVPPDRAHRS